MNTPPSRASLSAEIRLLQARVAQLEDENRKLARLSVTDSLTGLPNQRAFRDVIRREIKRALRADTDLGLVLFDVDDFKALNDAHGHAVGDAILARVAKAMQRSVREVDMLARYGGEEFALVAPGTGARGALMLAEKIRMTVGRTPFPVISLDGPREARVTVSAGVARFRGDEQLLFADADRALYRAKELGKDCVVCAQRPEA